MDPTLDQLKNLRDVHTPEAISWWPLAPGWWMVLALLLLIAVSLFLFYLWRKKTALRKCALAELDEIKQHYTRDNDGTQCCASLSIFLRRVALARCQTADDKARVAGLKGQDWLCYLDCNNPEKAFSQGLGRVLVTAPYQLQAVLDDAPGLFKIIEDWVRST